MSEQSWDNLPFQLVHKKVHLPIGEWSPLILLGYELLYTVTLPRLGVSLPAIPD